jgi:hypothetical protein
MKIEEDRTHTLYVKRSSTSHSTGSSSSDAEAVCSMSRKRKISASRRVSKDMPFEVDRIDAFYVKKEAPAAVPVAAAVMQRLYTL